jgi:hypothetical protein
LNVIVRINEEEMEAAPTEMDTEEEEMEEEEEEEEVIDMEDDEEEEDEEESPPESPDVNSAQKWDHLHPHILK